MDTALSWLALISGLIAVGSIVVAWLWKLSKWDTAIKSIPGVVENQKKFEKRLDEDERKIERISLITEPLWESICANLPGILKMHSSPDPLAHALHENATKEELECVICRLKDEIEKTRDADPGRAISLVLALAAVKVKLKEAT